MIVFGHNNFNLLTVMPAELGMIDNQFAGIKFQLRQKYGHLFWIPFIPLGTIWVVNRGDGKLYHCPPEVENTLRQRYPRGGSIFAWSGILLIAVIAIIYTISEKVSEHRWKKHYDNEYVESVEKLQQNISQLRPGQFLLLTGKESGGNSYGWQKLPLKVLKVNADNIVAGTYAEGFASATFTADDAAIVQLDLQNNIRDSFTITKEQLKKSVAMSRDEINSVEGFPIKDFYLGGVFSVVDVRDIGGPMLAEKTDAAGKSAHYFEIINKGFDVTADSIVTKTPGISWQLSKKHYLGNGEVVAVKTDGSGQAVLYCSDTLDHHYKYEIDNQGYSITFTRLQ